MQNINTHNDLPLAVDKREITYDMLSPFQKHLLNSFPEIKMSKIQKLVPSFLPKYKYVCLLRNLQFYLDHGLQLKKVHRVIRAKQAHIFMDYISFNSQRRALARTKYEITYFKNLNNLLYGKTVQNVRAQVDLKFCTNLEQFKKLCNNPNISDVRQLDNNLAIVLFKKSVVKLNKPIFIGWSVLENSKTLVYSFHYDYMGQKYGENCNLLNMDTDGLMYEIFTENVYQDMHENLSLFDTNNYPKEHFLYSTNNKKVPGKFQDEKAGMIINSCACPKPKMISLEAVNNGRVDSHKRAKGIKKQVIEKTLTHDDYKAVVMHDLLTYSKMNTFRSINQQIGTYSIVKVGLHSFDDKRYLLNNIVSLSNGHYLIPELQKSYDNSNVNSS